MVQRTGCRTLSILETRSYANSNIEKGLNDLSAFTHRRTHFFAILIATVALLLFWAAAAYGAYGSETLRWGSTGVSVSELQYDLTALGYPTSGVDGKFGGNTYNAVISFQQANALTADGLVGSRTKDTLAYLINMKNQSEGYKRIDYVVQSGDTLWILANRYKTTVEDIMYKSGIASDWLTVGQPLSIRVPSGTDYIPPAQPPANPPNPPTPPAPQDPPSRGDGTPATFWRDRMDWLQPVKGHHYESQAGLEAYFGAYRSNSDGSPRSHAGIDYVNSPGTPVYAMADGKVLRFNTYGFYAGTGVVEVENYDGSVARYAEIRPSTAIQNGQRIVRRGDVIGTMVTNSANGMAMLHLEMYYGYDPYGNKMSGALSQWDNTTYWYTAYNPDAGPFYRRADLINGIGSIYLPRE